MENISHLNIKENFSLFQNTKIGDHIIHIIFHPTNREIELGDFYWITKKENEGKLTLRSYNDKEKEREISRDDLKNGNWYFISIPVKLG